MADNENSSGTEPDVNDRVQELERELAEARKALETADARLQKRSLERQLAKKAADAAYDIVQISEFVLHCDGTGDSGKRWVRLSVCGRLDYGTVPSGRREVHGQRRAGIASFAQGRDP